MKRLSLLIFIASLLVFCHPVSGQQNQNPRLFDSYGRISDDDVIVIPATADETNERTVEVWVLPPGAAPPNPYANDDKGEDPESLGSHCERRNDERPGVPALENRADRS